MAEFKKQIKKVAVYTSGGDAPGMNAATRAVVRLASVRGLECVGIIGGYAGMLGPQFKTLTPRDVANTIQRGGTIIKTGRSLEFMKPDYRKKLSII
jgi:6-phosphofructokinase 1